MSAGTNRNMPARNTLVQLLALYTNPESHSAQRHRQRDRRTDIRMMPIADRRLKTVSMQLELYHRFQCRSLRHSGIIIRWEGTLGGAKSLLGLSHSAPIRPLDHRAFEFEGVETARSIFYTIRRLCTTELYGILS